VIEEDDVLLPHVALRRPAPRSVRRRALRANRHEVRHRSLSRADGALAGRGGVGAARWRAGGAAARSIPGRGTNRRAFSPRQDAARSALRIQGPSRGGIRQCFVAIALRANSRLFVRRSRCEATRAATVRRV